MNTRAALLLAAALLLGACTTAPADPPPSTPPPGAAVPVLPTPVGAPLSAPVTAVIGAAGGTFSSPDGQLRLDIPAGALSGDQTLSLQEIENHAPGRAGRAFRLGPEGLTFARPVQLTLRYTDADVEGSAPELLSVASQDARGVWQMYARPSLDLAAKTVRVQTRHFSDWSMVRGLQLQPARADVYVGQSVPLRIVACALPDDDPADPLDDLLPMPGGKYECAYTFQSLSAKNWAVNGTVGGNGSVGTVQASGLNADGTAQYTAPAKIPPGNPVAVSVNVSEVFGRPGVQTLVSNVTVKDGQAWQGNVTYTESGAQAWTMRDGFEGSGMERAHQTHTFKVVGVKDADAYNTTLLLEQVGTADYSDVGHMEKKIYEICQALGPKILRHHFIYDRDFRMSGAVKTTIEARLNLVDGRYSLAINPKDVTMIGQDAVTDVYKDGCAETTNDRSHTKPVQTIQGPTNLHVEGALDPTHPNSLSGAYNGRGEVFVQPTTYRVEWNLSRGQ